MMKMKKMIFIFSILAIVILLTCNFCSAVDLNMTDDLTGMDLTNSSNDDEISNNANAN